MVIPHTLIVKETLHSRVLGLVGQVWRYRSLVKDLAWRDFRARYVGSALGVAWAVLEPLVQFTLYLAVFAGILGMRFAPGTGVGSYGLFLLSGLVPFLALQEVVVRAVTLVRDQAALVRHVNVPLVVLLTGSLFAVLLRHAVALVLVFAINVAAGTVLLSKVWLLPVGVVTLLGLGFGLALLLVPVGAYVPDTVPLVASGLSIAFFMSPIVYTEAAIPPRFAAWLEANPILGLLQMFRAGLLGTDVRAGSLVVTLGATLVALVLGSLFFVARERSVRDVV
jgi:lipopolysaccharide transport system permease protein